MLKESLGSAFNQTHRPLEVVVVDDSGEEHARQTITAYPESVEYVVHEDHHGAQAARETGSEVTTGDYVQFLDNDGRLHQEKIARQVELLKESNG